MADQQDCKFKAPDPDPQVVELFKKAYRGNSTIKSQGQVKNLMVKIKDFDGTELELYECIYKLGPVEAPRLIKKGYPSDEKFAANYEFISNFRHPTAVQVDNYYLNAEYLVLSLVNGTFSKWFSTRNYNDLFTPEGEMFPLIRQMIIELSTLVESLLARKMAPVDLGLKDLYIQLLPDGTPKLQVLITEVRKASTTAHMEGAWASVRKIVQDCFTSHGFHPNAATQSFCNFIGIPEKNIGRLLEDFPDQWDNSRKGVFLLESCANAGQVSYRINNSGLRWPSDGLHYPQLLLDLMEHSKEKSGYNENFPYDYVKLSRNSYKHFKYLTRLLKAQLGGDTDGLLRQIEEWSPNIWSMLYTALNAP